jgi:hypothetical protein
MRVGWDSKFKKINSHIQLGRDPMTGLSKYMIAEQEQRRSCLAVLLL